MKFSHIEKYHLFASTISGNTFLKTQLIFNRIISLIMELTGKVPFPKLNRSGVASGHAGHAEHD